MEERWAKGQSEQMYLSRVTTNDFRQGRKGLGKQAWARVWGDYKQTEELWPHFIGDSWNILSKRMRWSDKHPVGRMENEMLSMKHWTKGAQRLRGWRSCPVGIISLEMETSEVARAPACMTMDAHHCWASGMFRQEPRLPLLPRGRPQGWALMQWSPNPSYK